MRALITIHRPLIAVPHVRTGLRLPLRKGLHTSAVRRRDEVRHREKYKTKTQTQGQNPGQKRNVKGDGAAAMTNDKVNAWGTNKAWLREKQRGGSNTFSYGRRDMDSGRGEKQDHNGSRDSFATTKASSGYTASPERRVNLWKPKNVLPKEEYLRTEMKYLQDPYKLAEHVAYMLGKDGEEKALAMIRISPMSVAVTVSWNHMIDYYMRNGSTKKALGMYNEMKKRAQRPDSHTYLLLLRGLAQNVHVPGSLGKALSLYHAMSAPKSRVSPSIIHTNAVLKVCGRANDLESMWDIASKLEERGPHAANNWTYTTLLQAIRENAKGTTAGGENPENAQRREAAIVEGRRLWAIIIQRWREGDVVLDDQLVNAMGKLLLIGSRPRDWDDVLSLIQQTMNIPRLVPRLGTIEREESGFKRIRAPHTPTDMKNDVSLIADELDEPRPGSEFDSFDKVAIRVLHNLRAGPTVGRRSACAYAHPSNMTLSLIAEAGLKLVAKRAVKEYWDLLTDPDSYGIVPDQDNLHTYLRVLRSARASSESLTLLTDDFPRCNVPLLPKTFRIAMSTCVRDSLNPHAFDTASRLLDLAQNTLRDPDFKTLGMYVDMAAKSRDVALIARALDRLQPGIVNLRSYLNFGPSEAGAGPGDVDQEAREDAVELMKKMIGCFDLVLKEDKYAGGGGGAGHRGNDAFGVGGRDTQGKLPENVRKVLMERRSRLAAFVTREHEKQEKRWKARSERREAERREGELEGKAEVEDAVEEDRPERVEEAGDARAATW